MTRAKMEEVLKGLTPEQRRDLQNRVWWGVGYGEPWERWAKAYLALVMLGAVGLWWWG